jgi:aryl-alcohol dehydrogenase-like predicted oxidoreductase
MFRRGASSLQSGLPGLVKTTTLGMTGLEVSRIALGTWELGGEWGAFDERQAVHAIRSAYELGVNVFDSAQAYGFGDSERLLGRALAYELSVSREQIVLATKGGLRRTREGLVRDSSPKWLRRGVEESLEALGVEYIDLFQVHWPDPLMPFDETVEGLQALVDEGKIRHVGVSNFDTRQLAAFSRTRPAETVQPPYHLFRRDIESDLLPYCREHDVGVLVYGPLAHGLLSGALDEATRFAPGDWRSRSPIFRGVGFQRALAAVRELEDFARQRGFTVAQLAIAWTLSHPAVHAAIVGSRRSSHVADAVAALDLNLSIGDLAEIDEIVSRVMPIDGPAPETV